MDGDRRISKVHECFSGTIPLHRHSAFCCVLTGSRPGSQHTPLPTEFLAHHSLYSVPVTRTPLGACLKMTWVSQQGHPPLLPGGPVFRQPPLGRPFLLIGLLDPQTSPHLTLQHPLLEGHQLPCQVLRPLRQLFPAEGPHHAVCVSHHQLITAVSVCRHRNMDLEPHLNWSVGACGYLSTADTPGTFGRVQLHVQAPEPFTTPCGCYPPLSGLVLTQFLIQMLCSISTFCFLYLGHSTLTQPTHFLPRWLQTSHSP